MQKFLLTVLITSVAWLATGQTTTLQPTPSTPRTRATTTPPATSPRTQPAPSTYNPNTAAKPRLTPKSGTMQPDNAAAKSSAARPESSVERNNSNTATRPSRTSATKKTTTRYNGSGTARTVTTPAKKTAAPPVVQPVAPVRINWITLEEALEKSKTEKRKIFVDVMTDWCGWCKRMDETTFTDPAVAKYLNDHFYAVKFNAEQNSDIVFQNKTYRFKSSNGRGYHELAAEWLNNRLSFPTSVFLDESLNLIQPLPGYQDASKLQAILNYFGTDSHRTTPWETYEKNFANRQ